MIGKTNFLDRSLTLTFLVLFETKVSGITKLFPERVFAERSLAVGGQTFLLGLYKMIVMA